MRDAVTAQLQHLDEVALRGRHLVRVARPLRAVHELRGIALVTVDRVLELDLTLTTRPLEHREQVLALAVRALNDRGDIAHVVLEGVAPRAVAAALDAEDEEQQDHECDAAAN